MRSFKFLVLNNANYIGEIRRLMQSCKLLFIAYIEKRQSVFNSVFFDWNFDFLCLVNFIYFSFW